MDPAEPPRRVELEPEHAFALAAWLALALVLARSAVVVALELAHHGDRELAGLRLAHAFPELAGAALSIALAAALAAWSVALVGARLRFVAVPLYAVLVFIFLWGRMDEDRSLRIGLDTTLGRVALGVVGAASLVLAFAYFGAGRLRVVRSGFAGSWRAIVVPLALVLAAAFLLRTVYGGLSATMDVRSAFSELAAGEWEARRSHPEGPPARGVLCPSAEYRADGAARPALVLPPPALVRFALPDAGILWLVGGAGIDHGVAEDGLARYPGHSVRFEVRLDGAPVFEAVLEIGRSPAWADFDDGGLRVPGGAELELETALLDASGAEIQPSDPLRAGFGGLALERRERIARAPATPEHPNIVLVLLDTLRADRTSAYGYARPTTPHLDALARRGILAEEALATASWTWPSTASILTGLQPDEHGVQDAASSILASRVETLAEALQRAGYTTAAWSGSPLIVPEKGFDQGFEFFDASREGRVRRSDLFLPGALEWLAAARERRFFVYLHLMEPHSPLVPLAEGRALFAPDVPKSFDPRKIVDYGWELQSTGFSETGERQTERVVTAEEQRWISDLYDASVWSADHQVGRLLARLAELGLAENTIVAVTSDHGEELFDHGLLSHAHTIHRELVRVPLVIAGPGVPAGERVTVPRSGAVVAPTLARLGGTALEGFPELADPLALLRGGEPDAPILFSTRHGWWNGYTRQPILGLRRGTSVLHLAPQATPWGTRVPANGQAGEIRLYDLARDPNETTDISVSDPERARALRDELLSLIEELARGRIESTGGVDEATLDMLRKMGYAR